VARQKASKESAWLNEMQMVNRLASNVDANQCKCRAQRACNL